MEVVRLYPECVKCLLDKQLERCPKEAPIDTKIEYIQKVLKIVAEAQKSTSAPVLVRQMYDLQKEMFGLYADYTEVKSYFNQIMLRLEEALWNNIQNAKDPFEMAIQYAMMGNYIDFAAVKNVDETKLQEFIQKASEEKVNEKEMMALREELKQAKNVVYLLDNCGEVVIDKLFMKLIQQRYPNVHITAMVRGGQVMNDVTIEDANEVNLSEVATVLDNGCNIAGTSLLDISNDAKKVIDNADIIISKGQGNFETLHQCGKNIYYIFMCKCSLFVNRFHLPQFSGVLVNEKHI